MRTLGGALLISAISDVLLLRGFSTGVQILVKGVLVLVVVITVHVRTTRGRR
jgi:ribose/xylose/arabinose/galactoside ABC-type transport system permease subunit